MLTFSVTHSCAHEDDCDETCSEKCFFFFRGGGKVGKLMQRASELRCRGADHFCLSRQHGGRDGGGRRVAGKATQVACRKKGRFSVSDCWKARRRGVGVGGGGGAGRLILGVGGQGGQREGVAVWCGLGVVLFLLSQMEFGSAHLL